MIKFEENVNLSHFSTIKVGGIAKKVYFPENIEQVRELILKAKEEGKLFIPIGVGSNLIFRDGVLDHIFVSTKNLKRFSIKKKKNLFIFEGEAGVSFKTIISVVKKYNLEGFENLSGIPASLGGATAMNAGAFGTEIFDIIEEVKWIDKNGNIHVSKKEEIEYGYRYTLFQNGSFVYSTKLKLKPSKKNISELIKNHLLERNRKQPLNLPTTGSTYKNPEKAPAGYLLEKAGFKGKRFGDIGFSEKHANFLVNYGNGTYSQLINLLENAEKTVKSLFGITLEREVKIVE